MKAILRTEHHKQQAHQAIDRVDFAGGKRVYKFVLVLKRARRTLPQLRLYWLLVTAIADETGGADKGHKDAIHEFLKRKFLKWRDFDAFGVEFRVCSSTSDLDTAQFTQYIDDIYQWARDEQGIVLPRPDDLGFDEFYLKYEDADAV